ncbi:MAG: hypothetical protein ACM3MI_06140 [Clostridiales bacterium]
MNKTKIKRIMIGLPIIGITLILIFGVLWIIRFVQIDSCLDKGGKWNYDLKKCECLSTIDTSRIAEYYWKTDFDTILNREYLKRGKMLDSISKSPNELIEILNMRPNKCKIDYVEITRDTIKIKILEDEYLTEQMGTTGAECYMAETIYTLTENDLIHFVRFEMGYGSHASPGLYCRKDYERMIKK